MAPFYYSNGFSKLWYQDNFKDSGFRIKEIQPYGNYFTYLAQELARLLEIAELYGQTVKNKEEQAIVGMLAELMKQAKCDRGSDEIQCLGHFVEAEKE